MVTNPVLYSLRNSASLLRNADMELLRPQADSVILCACHSIRNAVMGFFKTFLDENHVNSSSNSLENLLADCRSLEPAFNNIELTSFECKTEEGCHGYCLDVSKVSECLAQAKSIEEFVLTSLRIPREEIYN